MVEAEQIISAAEEVVGEGEGAHGEEVDEADDGMEQSYEEIEWTPNHKLKRISEVDETELPASYRSNTKKEKLCLEYVANFERQFIDLYPFRAPLLLCPINECGTPKFICTTVRPSQLPYKALYDYEECAAFVADYVRYEPLELPTVLPRHMPSPTSTLRWQAGDCFDMSVLLCSLLAGIGYDAYVAVGYAHKRVTRCDQSKRPVGEGKAAAASEAGEPRAPNKYRLPRRPPPESKFLKAQKAEDDAAAAAARAAAALAAQGKPAAAAAAAEEEDDDEELMDELRGRRVHAWVVLLAGKRELPDHFLIEPSTGAVQRVDDAHSYYGLEALFSASNYWVNMQGLARPCRALSWELADTAHWEHVFVDASADALLDELAGVDGLELGKGGRADGEGGGGDSFRGAEATDAAAAAAAADEHRPLGGGGGAAVDASPDDAAAADALADQQLDLPPSWVAKLALTPAQLESRCPGRHKETLFHKGALHKWPPYAREDGMVARLTLYADGGAHAAAAARVREVRETFEQRKDKLVRRTSEPAADRVVEEFAPGRPFGLRTLEQVEGVRRRFHFYAAARLDGLLLREEALGRKTTEHYVGRDDRLIYRSVTFDAAAGAGAGGGGVGVGIGGKAGTAELTIVKMTEKYARDAAVDAERDVCKRVFNVKGGFIRVHHHCGPGRVTASSRVYHKERWPPAVTLVDPFATRPTDAALREDYQALVVAERECLQAYREQERQIKELLARRAQEESEWQLAVSVYDTARSRHYLDAERKEDAAGAAVKHDYLTPFLPNPKSHEQLDRVTALRVREACLKNLRDRLVERATIIQSRLDEENANLAKKTSTFSRNRDHADKETEEEYERYCQAAMFRIQIIDERLKRHEKQALQKYEEMDSRLRADPRMLALLNPQ